MDDVHEDTATKNHAYLDKTTHGLNPTEILQSLSEFYFQCTRKANRDLPRRRRS